MSKQTLNCQANIVFIIALKHQIIFIKYVNLIIKHQKTKSQYNQCTFSVKIGFLDLYYLSIT